MSLCFVIPCEEDGTPNFKRGVLTDLETGEPISAEHSVTGMEQNLGEAPMAIGYWVERVAEPLMNGHCAIVARLGLGFRVPIRFDPAPGQM